jgi:hypothetical protein
MTMKKLIIAITIGLGLLLSGCGSMEAEYDPVYEEEYFNDENTDQESPDPVINDPQDQGGGVETDNAAPEFENRKIIYRANLIMAVMDPTAVYEDVVDTIANYTAYVEEADITTNRYEITVRVLSSEFDDFVEDIKTNGELVSYSKTSEDVTNAYSTFEARRLALDARHTRILELIEAAVDLDTILELEEERYEIEAELNNIGTVLNNYDSLVDYSTVTLRIQEAVQEIVVLPRTMTPGISITERTKSTITVELYNGNEENTTLQVDVYQNGEFITEYEENVFGESRTTITFTDLKSDKEYTFKVTALTAEHRVSNEETRYATTEPTYGNRTVNTFMGSVDILVVIFEVAGLTITALLPFAFVGSVVFIPARILYIKKFRKIEEVTPSE